MNRCPKCKSKNVVKNGFMKGKQRYKCNICKYTYTKSYCGRIKPIIKKQALILYLEGLGYRSISRFLRCSHVSIYNWIMSFGRQVENLKETKNNVKVVEIDEIHTYIGRKKTIAGCGLLLIELGKKYHKSLLAVGE